jgi:hypothetical protein
MNIILLGMALANYALLAITVVLGFLVMNPAEIRAAQIADDWGYHWHLPMAILTALFSLLTHCLVFTYFLGTTRWVRETVTAYALDERFPRESRSCRSRSFAVAIISMLMVVAAVASGGGAHTGTWPLWVHWAAPALTYGFMLFAYRIEYLALERHIALTDEVMNEVNRIRVANGMDPL